MNKSTEPIQRTSNMVIDDSPLYLPKKLAKCIGVNEAIFVQQLHFWLTNKKMGREFNGRKWIHNSLQEWIEDNFIFWTRDQLIFIIKKLVKDGIIIKWCDWNRQTNIKTMWYTIDYNLIDKIASLDEPIERIAKGKKAKAENLINNLTKVAKLPDCPIKEELANFCSGNLPTISKNTITKNTEEKENTTLALPHPVSLSTSTKQSVNGGGYEENMANEKVDALLTRVMECKDLPTLDRLENLFFQANYIDENTRNLLLKMVKHVKSNLSGDMANETLESFERGWNQAQSGQVHPIDTLWQGIDNDTAVNEQADMAKIIRELQAKVAELEGRTMAKDHVGEANNMMVNHLPDTGNMVSGGYKTKPTELVTQASPLPLGFATPSPNTQNMATNAFNQQKRIVGQNNGNVGDSSNDKPAVKREPVAKTVKPAVEKQPDFAQEFLKRWCEEVLCYGKRDAITGEYDRATYEISWGREKRTVKALLTKGTDIETKFQDLAGSYRYMKQKAYCADRHVFIQEVAGNLPAWIQAGRPSSQVVVKPQWQVAKEENNELLNLLLSVTKKYGRNAGAKAKEELSTTDNGKKLLKIITAITGGMYSPLVEMSEEKMISAFWGAVTKING